MAKILAVDDQTLVLMAIQEALKNTVHYVVDEAYNGEEAIEKARKYKPDLILMDINMPGEIDGLEAARIIHRELGIPVIFVTAYSTPAYMQKLKSISAYGFIVKPFQKHQLENSIEIALYRNKTEKLLKNALKKQKRNFLQERVLSYLLAEINKEINPYDKLSEYLDFICQYLDLFSIQIFENKENNFNNVTPCTQDPDYFFIKEFQLEKNEQDVLTRPRLVTSFNDIPADLKTILNAKGILSLVSIPIYLDRKYFGMILFFNSKENYRFQIRFMKMAANIISMIIKRNENILLVARVEKEKIEREKMILEFQRLASLGELSSAINHEISQPLQSIKVLSDSVVFWYEEKKAVSEETMLSNFRKISARVEKVNKIIKNMNLLFKSPEKIELENVYINLLVVSTLTLFEERLKKQDIELVLDLDSKIKEILSSPIQVQQIISNLIKNAINALAISKQPKKKITLQTLENNDSLIINVIDNGSGVPDEIKEKIFQPFFSTFQTSSSMGMGLYIINNIIKTLNGSITVSNNPQGGAVFSVELKRVFNQ